MNVNFIFQIVIVFLIILLFFYFYTLMNLQDKLNRAQSELNSHSLELFEKQSLRIDLLNKRINSLIEKNNLKN